MKTKVWKTAQALEIHFTAGDSGAPFDKLRDRPE